MPIHMIRYSPREAAADVRRLLERLEDELAGKPGWQGKITTARELVTEVEDQMADTGEDR